MIGAILASGNGARLRQGGIEVPKPLVNVGGRALIDHAIGAFVEAGVGDIACVVNESFPSVEPHCREAWPQITFDFLQRSTPSSMETLFTLSEMIGNIPFVAATVDTILAPQTMPAFLEAVAANPGAEATLALTDHIDDEKPLWATMDAHRRIIDLGTGSRGSGLVTAGVYFFTPAALADKQSARAAKFTALRQFLGDLIRRDMDVRGHLVGKSVDVDRVQDLTIAENFLASLPRSAAGIGKAGDHN